MQSGRFKWILLTGGAWLALTGGAAFAQQTSGDSEEIVVTATRREQALADVPSNLMAYGAEELETRGINNLQDLSRIVPGLAQANFDLTKGGWGGSLPILRGVNANNLGDVSPNVSPASVAIYYGNAALGTALHMADIERVEVLRGPQGTLYGSGAMSGTIQIVPAGPDMEEVYLDLNGGLSTTNHSDELNHNLEAVLNLGIGERFGVRLLAGTETLGGYIDETRLVALDGPNIGRRGPAFSTAGVPVGALPTTPETYTSAYDTNDRNLDYYRLVGEWRATDALTFRLTYDTQSIESDNRAIDNPQFAGASDYEGTQRILSPSDRELEVISFDTEADFGFATLSVTASTYDDSVDVLGRDVTDVFQRFVGPFYFNPYALATPPRLQGTAFEFSSSTGDTFEVRLASNGDNRFNWITGLFYTKQEQQFSNEYWLPGVTEYSDFVGATWPYRPATGFPDAPGYPGDLYWAFERSIEFEETSAFLDVDYNITDRWEVGAGVRFFQQEFAAAADSQIYHCNFFCSEDGLDPRGRSTNNTSADFEDQVFRLTTNYRFNDNLLGYANWAQGFRRGGSNAISLVGIFQEPANLLTFEPDKVNSFEIGLRGENSNWFYTAALFYMVWDKPQIEGLLPSGSWYAVVNGEEARNVGLELEANGHLTDNVRLSLGYSYVNAELSEDFAVPATGSPVVGTKGDPLPGVPEHSFTGSLVWRQPDLMPGWDGLFNVNVSYRSSIWTNLLSAGTAVGVRNPAVNLDGFAVVNTSYAFEGEDARITLFVDNLFEERGVSAVRPQIWSGDTTRSTYGEYVMRPRTIGVRASYTFN